MLGTPTEEFWGKYDDGKRKDAPDVEPEWHPLVDHCADVAAVVEALLIRTLLGRRLARLGGQDELSSVQIARLGFFAALHDLGKFNVGFQRQILGKQRTGHVVPAVELLDWECQGFEASNLFYERVLAVGVDTWFATEEAGVQMLVSTVCHHGRPHQGSGDQAHHLWRRSGGLDPLKGLRKLIDAAGSWFPEALADDEGAERIPLPAHPAFQHGWNGVLNLADWLGSDRDLFPFSSENDGYRMPSARRWAGRAVRAVGLEVAESRRSLKGREPTLAQLLGRNVLPRPLQEEILRVPVDADGSIIVIEATTGEGKTEAALLRFLRLFGEGHVDGLYFALPTRAAASQIYGRVHRAMERVFPAEFRPAVLQAVPGYALLDEVEIKLLPGFEVQWPDDWQDEKRRRAWAAERSKRFLAGPIVVGTVDQALLSALSVKHSHLRAAPLLRHLLVVDEVHSSDAYMTRILESVLDHELAAGGHALLLSATLGGDTRSRLLRPMLLKAPSLAACLKVGYPVLTWRGGSEPKEFAAAMRRIVEVKTSPILEDEHVIAVTALDAARSGAHVIVLRNTVKGAVATQGALETLAAQRGSEDLLFRAEGVAAPHHSRFAAVDRTSLDAAVVASFLPKREHSRGVVLVATQTVEQSLDLDADLLLTDLCPIDVLLQRIGRLHRHLETARPEGFHLALAVVLVPAERDLGKLLRDSGEARATHGLGSVYPDLRTLETTWQHLEALQRIEIPGDCRKLVEECLHPESLSHVAESGDKWKKHQEKTWGSMLSKRQAADLSEMKWDVPFGELSFSDTSEKIRTRLGEEDVRLVFENPFPVGPFGHLVPELSLRHYQVPQGVDLNSATPENCMAIAGGGFQFEFGGELFVYDRFGVCRVED